MSDAVNTSTCLTKAQAAQILGTSTKGVERAVAAGELVQHWRRQAGTPDVAVYFPDEVAALVAKRAQTRRRGPSGGVLVPGPAVGSTNGNGHAPRGTGLVAVDTPALSPFPPGTVTPPGDWLTVLITAAQRVLSQTSQTSQTARPRVDDLPSYVPLAQAAAYTGLSERYLRKMIKVGTLTAIRDDRQWKIYKPDVVGL